MPSKGHMKEKKKCASLYKKMKMYEERMNKHLAKARKCTDKAKKAEKKMMKCESIIRSLLALQSGSIS